MEHIRAEYETQIHLLSSTIAQKDRYHCSVFIFGSVPMPNFSMAVFIGCHPRCSQQSALEDMIPAVVLYSRTTLCFFFFLLLGFQNSAPFPG